MVISWSAQTITGSSLAFAAVVKPVEYFQSFIASLFRRWSLGGLRHAVSCYAAIRGNLFFPKMSALLIWFSAAPRDLLEARRQDGLTSPPLHFFFGLQDSTADSCLPRPGLRVRFICWCQACQ